MKLKDIMGGTRAIKRVSLPLVNVPCSLLPDIPELAEQRAKDAQTAASAGAPEVPAAVEVGLRVLTGDEFLSVYEKARKMAEARGSTRADESDPVYNMAESVYICALACVDPDSDPHNPEPFFGQKGDVESGVKEILASIHIGRDGLIFLAEQQEHWQDVCNPQGLKMSPERMFTLVGEVAASDDAAPFLRLRPGMRWSFARFMALLVVSSQMDKSLSGSTSPES